MKLTLKQRHTRNLRRLADNIRRRKHALCSGYLCIEKGPGPGLNCAVGEMLALAGVPSSSLAGRDTPSDHEYVLLERVFGTDRVTVDQIMSLNDFAPAGIRNVKVARVLRDLALGVDINGADYKPEV